MNILRKIWMDDEGQDLVEYALIAGLIAVAAFVSIQVAGSKVSVIWSSVASALTTAA